MEHLMDHLLDNMDANLKEVEEMMARLEARITSQQ
jgi:hypothetical protein